VTSLESVTSGAPSPAQQPPGHGGRRRLVPGRLHVEPGTCSSSTSRSPISAASTPGPSLSSLSWVLNGYTIVFAAVLVPAGGPTGSARRRVLLAGLIVFSAGSLLCGPGSGRARADRRAGSSRPPGAGLMVPASLSLLLASVPAASRARAIGTWSALGAPGRCAWPGDRRQPGPAEAGAGCSGSTCRLGWRPCCWPAGVVPESRDENVPRPAGPDRRGPAGRPRWAWSPLALVEAPGWGWGSTRFVGPADRRGSLRRGDGRPVCAAPLPGHRAWPAAVAGPSAGLSWPRSSTTRRSAPSC